MLHTFEVNGYVPGVGYVTTTVRTTCSATAQRAFLAQYPSASISYAKQLD